MTAMSSDHRAPPHCAVWNWKSPPWKFLPMKLKLAMPRYTSIR